MLHVVLCTATRIESSMPSSIQFEDTSYPDYNVIVPPFFGIYRYLKAPSVLLPFYFFWCSRCLTFPLFFSFSCPIQCLSLFASNPSCIWIWVSLSRCE
ncbi:hypothetical protein N658DRAFT_125759 [Parathielavia hyrcaniae]|uniref:Uncharacterized protein n=1 Tax=Parathielavia hyrcaniae TaxID=113614 RepID=A0AAN6Q9W4_9PEZI|nr:hypothetical protein N658DRAFT_125759 [Parathielavia hyrcaniae]